MADVNLVLSKFEFDPHASQTVAELRGRPAGIIGFVLNLLGLSQQSFLVITREEVQFRFTSLSGVTYILCPLDTITSAYCGVSKPMWALWLGLILLPFVVAGVIPGLIGVVLLYHFYRTKFLTLTFSTGEMLATRGLDFAAFTKDGKQVKVEDLLEIVSYVNTVLVNVRPDPLAPSGFVPMKRDVDDETVEDVPQSLGELAQRARPGVEKFAKQSVDIASRLGKVGKAAVQAGKQAMKDDSEPSMPSAKSPAAPKADDSVWQTGEHPVTPPSSGLTGSLDPNKVLAREKLQEGFALFKERKYPEALVVLQEAQALDPTNQRINDGVEACRKKLVRLR